MNWKQKTQEHWNKTPCGTKEEHRTRYESYPWLKKLITEIENKKVLEIGCGQGTDLQLFTIKNDALGIDITSKHLELAKGKGLNVQYGDAESIPFENNSFDVVYSFGVLHHTPNITKAINEIERVLRPRGKAIIMLYNKYSAHVAYLYLIEGLLKLNLLKKGKRKLLSEIEKGGGVVLVNLYSKKDIKKLFPEDKWKINYVSHHKVIKEDFVFIHHFLPDSFFRSVEKYVGFFMMFEVQKR